MENTLKIIIGAWLLAILIVISGIVMRNQGRPYRTGIFTIHKLAAIGSIVLIGIIIPAIPENRWSILNSSSLRISALILVIITIISGAIQSFKREMPSCVPILHKITSYLLILLIMYQVTSSLILKI